MDIHLVVVKPFSGLARGDIITDKAKITQILSSEQARSVVRVATPVSKGN